MIQRGMMSYYRRPQFTACLILMAAMAGCGSLEPEHTFARCDFSGKKIEARYGEILGSSAFAAHTIRFYEVKDNHQRLLLQTKFKNDGRNPKDHNIEFLENQDGTITIVLHGEEQSDGRYRLSSDHGDLTIESE